MHTLSCRKRLLGKFLSGDMEKTDRAVELFLKYHRQVQAAGDAAAMPQDDDEFGMDPEEARFLRRLDAGLFSLQVCAGGSRAVCPCHQPCLLCVVCARVWWSWRVVPTNQRATHTLASLFTATSKVRLAMSPACETQCLVKI